MFLPILLCSAFLAAPQFGPSAGKVLVNEYSQPNEYQLDIRLDASRRAELTACIERATGLDLPEAVTDYLVAEADGINLTYLPGHNHLSLTSTDYTPVAADLARRTGRVIRGCLHVGAPEPTPPGE